MKPSLRKPVGVLLLLFTLAIYVMLWAELLARLHGLSHWIQLPLFMLGGLLWLLPMKRWLLWMETGRWR